MTLKADLASIVGSENVTDEPDILEKYSKDYSFVKPRRPSVVAYARNSEDVQGVMKYASANGVAVTPRSSGIGFYGAGIPQQGGIVLDLSRMNRIIDWHTGDRRIKVEPGVTWEQIKAKTTELGTMVCNPLLPPSNKSAMTSAMEREAMLIPKMEYSEPFRTAELVLANGAVLHTGTGVAAGHVGGNHPEHFIPSNRLWMGAQGTLGIATWANLKMEWAPEKDKVFFLPFKKYADIPQVVYKIERMNLGNECLVLNNLDFAAILTKDTGLDIEALRAALPAWTVIFVSSGHHWFPEDKLAYEEEALMNLADQLGFEVKSSLGGIAKLDKIVLALVRGVWSSDTYWKAQLKGACHDIFFYTTMDRVDVFNKLATEAAADHGYATSDIGVYVQPVERARAACVCYGFACDRENSREVASVRGLYSDLSKRVVMHGGMFTTPYGEWADLVYSRSAAYTHMMKVAKNVFDPKNILNPGKLCF